MKKGIAFILSLLILLSSGCVLQSPEATIPENTPEPVVENTPEMPAEPAEPAEPEEPTEPDAPLAQGDLVFDTVTLFGEPISSDMLKDYDLVLVNFWADWCGWCVYEMPALQRIHEEYPNVLILGVLSFPNSLEDSLGILADNSITFPTLEPAGTLIDAANALTAFPTTMFFDSTGKEIAEPVVGSRSYEDWKAIIEDLLP